VDLNTLPEVINQQYLRWEKWQQEYPHPHPIIFDMHPTGAVEPWEYAQRYLDLVFQLLAENHHTVRVVLIPGQGNHSKDPGSSMLRQAVIDYFGFNGIAYVVERGNFGRICVWLENGRPVSSRLESTPLEPEELALEGEEEV